MKQLAVRVSLCLTICFMLTSLSCARQEPKGQMSKTPSPVRKRLPPRQPPPPPPPPLPAPYEKTVSFAICEDYDKGQNLKDIALDFELVKELGIDTMRVSFGWDDYEPTRGKYDFAWLHKFANLAAKYNLRLRPYICYAPHWATGESWTWSFPPKDYKDWYNFCYNLAKEMKRHPNIVSYEIWNEMDAVGWWDGTREQYKELLKQGALAIRAADPGKEILLGGMTRPNDDLLRYITEDGYAQYYDVVPVHCYVETWTAPGVMVEDYLTEDDFRWFTHHNNEAGGRKPLWVNEMGYSLLGRTESDQANYMCRAVSHLLASPDVRYIGWYEVKDLDPKVGAVGDIYDRHNHYLGITSFPDRKKRLGFHTLDMLTDLLDKKTLIPADDEVAFEIISGSGGRIFKHLFKISDGSQVLFIYSQDADYTVKVTLKTPGRTAHEYKLDNTREVYSDFTGNTFPEIALKAGEVRVFKILP